jgi:carboxypeptidase PM20D1
MLMAHMDVVPVEEETLDSWQHPPFEGRIADGYVWGRGALDDKLGVMGVLEAVESLLKAGMEPSRDVYIGFGHDEEIGGGNGAQNTARLLEERGVQLDFVLDEGGFISDGTALGSRNSVALVGVAEKGYLSVELTVEGSGGHSSMPPERTAIGLLSAAIDRLEKNRPAARVDGPVRRMLEGLAPELSFTRRVAIANLWAFERLVVSQLSRFPVTDSLIRTTTAPTMVSGGVKENILPAQARGTINFRIRPGESIETVLEHVKKTVKDPRVRFAPVPSALTFEPSEGSSPDSENYGIVHRTIRQAFPDVRVVPYLVVGATDSRHFSGLTKDVLKFVPIRMDPQMIKTVHGVNERVSLDQYADAIRFYIQLLVNAADRK